MLRSISTLTAIGLCFCWPVLTLAQDEITAMSFGEVPEDITISAGAASPIRLLADTVVTGGVTASGEIESGSGFRFPDGTIQTTASEGGSGGPMGPPIGLTANAGLYGNTIADMAPPNAYTEICVKNGNVLFDIHAAGDPTSGGNCVPGDIGWLIERFERDLGAAVSWTTARMECLKDGMRLPEMFEWKVACDDLDLFALSSMNDNEEWASNTGILNFSNVSFVAIPVVGDGSCNQVRNGIIARSDNLPPVTAFVRCAR